MQINMKRYILYLLLFVCAISFGQTSKSVRIGTIPAPTNYFKNGVVVFSFDDGLVSQYVTGMPLFQSYGIHFTSYVKCSGVVYKGGNPYSPYGGLIWSQIPLMSAAGFDIGCHTYNHVPLITITDDSIVKELTMNKDTLIAHGVPYPYQFCYPGGSWNARVWRFMHSDSSNRKTARTVAGDFWASWGRDYDKWALGGVEIDSGNLESTWTGGVAGIEARMDSVKLHKSCLHLFGHAITADHTGYVGIHTTPTTLDALIQYAQSKDLDIVTMRQLTSMMQSEPTTIPSTTFTLTATGTGAGIAYLNINCNDAFRITLTGGAKFYTDAAGTLNESTVWDLLPISGHTRYIRCASGTSTFTIPSEKIIEINNWNSSTNAPSLSGDISNLINLTICTIGGNNTLSGSIANWTSLVTLNIAGTNTLSGSVARLVKMTFFYAKGSNTFSGSIAGLTQLTTLLCWGSNTLSGSITGLTKLTYLSIAGSNTISGSIAGCTLLTYLDIEGNNSISGSIAGLTLLTGIVASGTNTISGSIAGCTLLTLLNVTGNNSISGSIAGLVHLLYANVTGTNSLTGDISALTLLYHFSVQGSNTCSFSTVINLHSLDYLNVYTTVTLTSDNVNQLLADFWANRDYAKTESTRLISIAGSVTSGAPTGQGIIDKAALQAYHSPTPPGTAVFWTVTTRG